MPIPVEDLLKRAAKRAALAAVEDTFDKEEPAG